MDKITVVVVDDHPIFLAGLQQLFKKQPDFELVGVAEDAAQLETVLAQTTPAVILMDIEMPERDGISATAFVRKHAPGTKVVMLTGYDNPDLIAVSFGRFVESQYVMTRLPCSGSLFHASTCVPWCWRSRLTDSPAHTLPAVYGGENP